MDVERPNGFDGSAINDRDCRNIPTSAEDRQPGRARWSERDVVLITYGDQISSQDASPLATFYRFLRE